MTKIHNRANNRRIGSRRGAAFDGQRAATSKDAPCGECGAKPGHSCFTLRSVRQVAEGREGAYLRVQKALHPSRGHAGGEPR